MLLVPDDLLSIPHLRAENLGLLLGRRFRDVSTDSRKVKVGSLFIALRGDRFDGHEFVASAFGSGATCAIVDRRADTERFKNRPYLVVRDTMQALGALAQCYRRKFDIPVIAVAGSNGKTTTKDMIAAVLKRKYRIQSTSENLNNQIGVPHTIFGLKPAHEIAVVEIGTNHPGEIKYLCDMLEPTHGLITNIGREHLEFFRTLDGVMREEGSLFRKLGSDGIGFVNADDPRVVRLARHLNKKVVFGFKGRTKHIAGRRFHQSDRGETIFSIKAMGRKSFEVKMDIPGRHAVANALAAATVGLSFGVPNVEIRKALAAFRSSDKRMEINRWSGLIVLNDTYNANSDSVRAALETMQKYPHSGRKIAVFGDMLELGARSAGEHRRVGRMVNELGIDVLLTFGKQARIIHDAAVVKNKIHFEQKESLCAHLDRLLSQGDLVLVKGSRGMRMEDIVNHIHSRWGTQSRKR